MLALEGADGFYWWIITFTAKTAKKHKKIIITRKKWKKRRNKYSRQFHGLAGMTPYQLELWRDMIHVLLMNDQAEHHVTLSTEKALQDKVEKEMGNHFHWDGLVSCLADAKIGERQWSTQLVWKQSLGSCDAATAGPTVAVQPSFFLVLIALGRWRRRSLDVVEVVSRTTPLGFDEAVAVGLVFYSWYQDTPPCMLIGASFSTSLSAFNLQEQPTPFVKSMGHRYRPML